MGVLGQSKDQGAAAVVPTAQGPVDKTGFFQNVGAGFRQAVAGPHSTRNAEAIYQSRTYDQIVKALAAEGEQGVDYVESPVRANSPFYHHVEGERINPNGVVYVPVKRDFRNPFVSGPSLTADVNPIQGFYLGGDEAEKQQIWGAIQRVRQRNPKFLSQFPDEASLIAHMNQQRQADSAAAQSVTSRAGTAGTVGQFIGGMAGSLASGDPENLVGGGFGSAAGKTFARTVIKRSVEGAGANAAAALIGVPGQMADANSLGQEMTPGDVGRQVAEAAGIGAAFGGAHILIPKLAEKGGQAVGAVAGKVASVPPVRDALIARSIAAGTIDDHSMLSEWQRAHNPNGVIDTSSPDERAAAHVILRDTTQRETSPLHNEAAGDHDHRLDAVANALGVSLSTPEVPTPAPVQTPTVRDRTEGGRKPAPFIDALHSAEGTGKNPDSSADGHFQFTKGTWLEYAPRVTDTKGMSEAQILALRHDLPTAQKAEQLFRADNARYLRERGLEDSPGNLSLAHFLGKSDAAKVLQAAPDTPIERLVDPKSLAANRSVLEGKSASEVIAWAHKRIGAAVDLPVARADAVGEADPLDPEDYSDVPYERATFKPDEIQTDAALMQYKSGADEAGVTGKLKDVTAWDPIMSSEILVWEGNDGRRVVVDGHQRVGLARRLAAQGQDIDLPALVVREADGITAAQARVLGALRNINLGTGSLLDNARVLRDLPDGAEMIRGAENRREIEGLSRLSYDAFGAAINGVVDPRIAAEIGKHAPEPSTHMAMVGLLARERVHNPAEAATIVRQALADGFGTADEKQLSLLGAEPQHSLYVPIARILAAAQKRLREEKRTFRVLSEKSARIEAAGNVLDRTANEEKVIGSDEALGILNATAHSAGPVRDALIAAARAELSGTRRGDAVNQFLDALGGIDLRSAARGAAEDGAVREPSGEAGGRDAAAETDEILARGNGPVLYDHAVAARDAAEPFSDPVGEAAKSQTALLDHDLLMQASGADAVRDDIRSKLMASGVGPEVARASAELYAANREAWAKRLGVTPMEYHQAHPLEFTNEAGTQGRVLDQPAYHGSPHIFDRFSLKHIGSGEGAQAYGYGLYFAGKKEVAEHYRESLASVSYLPKERSVAADKVAEYMSDGKGFEHARRIAKRYFEDDIKLADEFKDYPGGPAETWDTFKAKAQEGLDGLDSLTEKSFEKKKHGRLYHVEIPDDGEYLLWDEPLSKQPPKVKEALAKAGYKEPPMPKPPEDKEIASIVDDALKYARVDNADIELTINNDSMLYNRAVRHAEKAGVNMDDFNAGEYVVEHAKYYVDGLMRRELFSGESAYRDLVGKMSNGDFAKARFGEEGLIRRADELASRALHEAGIAGIKYLDGFSRAEGEGHHNYVIFDDSKVAIRHFEQDERGQIALHDGRAIISLFEKSDPSTILHETGHAWLEELKSNAEAGPSEVKADYKTVTDWFKENGHEIGPDGEIPRDAHELFARGFERYVMEGKAPTSALAKVFDAFKDWLTRIYHTVRGLNSPISDNVRGVFDRMLGAPAEQAAPPPPLFDLPETGFRLSDEGDAKPLHEIMREAEDDELAAKALRDCLTGKGEA